MRSADGDQDLRRHQRRRAEQRRVAAGQLRCAWRRGSGGGHCDGARAGRCRPGKHHLRRGARHGDAAGRSHRSRGADEGVPARHASRSSSARLGSVKTNLGHLDVAAGVTGLIKTGAVAPSQESSAEPALHEGESEARSREQSVLRERHAPGVEGHARRPATRRRELVRYRRHQRARGARRSARVGRRPVRPVRGSCWCCPRRHRTRSTARPSNLSEHLKLDRDLGRQATRTARGCRVHAADRAQRIRPSARCRLPRCGRRRGGARRARRQARLHPPAAAQRAARRVHVPGPGGTVRRDGRGTLSLGAGVSGRSRPLC